jgi:hypothetical protein
MTAMPHDADMAWMLTLPASLGLHRSVVASDHLHHGLWPADRPEMTLEEAQEALLDDVAALLPPPPARVLLVDCGFGLAAYRLAERGYRVTAEVAPPGGLAHAREAHRHPALEFRTPMARDREAVTGEGGFDAFVAIEPAGELAAPARLLARASAELADGGVVVLAGEFAGGRALAPGGGPPTASDLVVAMGELSFRQVERRVVSGEAAGTCLVMAERLGAATGAAAFPADEVAAALAAWRRRAGEFAAGRLGYHLVAARRDRHLVRAYRDGDEAAIVPMFREVFGVERTMEHWYWKYRDCPWGRHLIAEAVDRDGVLAGHYAGYPVPFHFAAHGGREFLSHQIGDTMTRLSARQSGLGKQGVLARMAAYYYARFGTGVPFVYGFNTGHIRKLGERYLGYEYIDAVARWARPAAGTGVPARGRLRAWWQGYSVTELASAGAETTELFERVKGSYGLLVRRDAEYLRWRYLECPDRRHRVLALRRRGVLVGWGVFSRRGTDLVWGDALVDRRCLEAMHLLLEHGAARLFPGVERVWGWFAPHPEWWAAWLDAAGFVRERDPDDLAPGFYFLADTVTRRHLAEVWYYTYGDSDLF